MKTTLHILIGLFLWATTGCENATATNAVRIANQKAEAEGSPFVWKTKSVGGGTMMFLTLAPLPSGPTRADPTLKQDVLAQIEKAEGAEGRAKPEIEDIKHMKDGKEVWVLKTEKEGIAYIIAFRATPGGGTDIGMSAPRKFTKEKTG